jgi:hypothetical protein
MRVHNVHSRELAAPSERIWEMVAALGSAEDELWPTERWPTSPIVFDRPIGPGASGGHGLIRYSVEDWEPGRRVGFRFAPGSGLDGVHGFEIDGAQLTHVLDARVSWRLRPLYRVLIKAHDTLVEDLLDKAERATGGRPAAAVPLPRVLRVANAIEGGLLRAAA